MASPGHGASLPFSHVRPTAAGTSSEALDYTAPVAFPSPRREANAALVCVVGPSSRPDADVDYTFAQALVKEARIDATFPVAAGRSVERGKLVIPGVSGAGAPVRLDFLDPGGASTGRLLPTGHASDILAVPGFGKVSVSLVDAANACVFVEAATLGLAGTELPDELDARPMCSSGSRWCAPMPRRWASHGRPRRCAGCG